MSTQSIKAFQNAYPKYKPSPATELRNEAAKLRAFGQSLLAKANRMEEIANEIEPAPRCSCGELLTFAGSDSGDGLTCWCWRCKARSERDGAVVFVYGNGRDRASAYADWRRNRDSF